MQVAVKYNIGDTLYPIAVVQNEKQVNCKSCNSTGNVSLADGESIQYPRCHGTGTIPKIVTGKWRIQIESVGTVVSISVTILSTGVDKIWYALDTTGRISNEIWLENLVFPTKKTANDECDIRNVGIQGAMK